MKSIPWVFFGSLVFCGCSSPRDRVDPNAPVFSQGTNIKAFVLGSWIQIDETANAAHQLPGQSLTSYLVHTVEFQPGGTYSFHRTDGEVEGSWVTESYNHIHLTPLTANGKTKSQVDQEWADYEAHGGGAGRFNLRRHVDLKERTDHSLWQSGEGLADLYIGRDGKSLERNDPNGGPYHEPFGYIAYRRMK